MLALDIRVNLRLRAELAFDSTEPKEEHIFLKKFLAEALAPYGIELLSLSFKDDVRSLRERYNDLYFETRCARCGGPLYETKSRRAKVCQTCEERFEMSDRYHDSRKGA